MNRFIILMSVLLLWSCKKETSEPVKISWVESLPGDFSFSKNWDYPEGVFRNEFGQLSCDGICPPETDAMMDENGKIKTDSLTAFYKVVDTTRLYHSLESNAWAYEMGEANFITAKKTAKNTIVCASETNIATHSSLHLVLKDDICIPTIELNSISNGGETKKYVCKSGNISIDKEVLKKGILKAEFSFDFVHPENPSQPMYWKGKIETPIENFDGFF